MWDYFHLADNSLNVQVFNATAAFNWQTWNKPRGVKMVSFYVVGAGGGGGNGASGAAGSNRGGGGGGGSGAIVRMEVPAFLLPDILYVSVARGGAPATNGLNTRVSVGPSINDEYTLVFATGATSGGNASGVVPGTAGAGGVAPLISDSAFSCLGTFIALAGVAGAAGGNALSSGNAVNALIGINLSGGAGGGGTNSSNVNNAGGAITGLGIYPTLAGGNAGGGVGAHGIIIRQPFCTAGGSGGGSNGTSGTGGAGGNAAIGSGGGGGGAGVTGGSGGRGGDGLVIITAY